MAHSAARESQKTIWERTTTKPPIQWEKWRIQVNLVILASENISLDTLLEPKPSKAKLPPELKDEAPFEGALEKTERERQIRNSHIKLKWELK